MEAKYLFFLGSILLLLLFTVSNLPYPPPSGTAEHLDYSNNRFQPKIPLSYPKRHSHSSDIPRHPLDPLTVGEINKVRKIIQSQHSLLFRNSKLDAIHSLVLEEPEKETVMRWRNGDKNLPPRKASVVARAGGVTYMLTVDIETGGVTRHDLGKVSGYPTMTVEDMTSSTWAPFGNAEFNRTIIERGVDLADVACLPISTGWFGESLFFFFFVL